MSDFKNILIDTSAEAANDPLFDQPLPPAQQNYKQCPKTGNPCNNKGCSKHSGLNCSEKSSNDPA